MRTRGRRRFTCKGVRKQLAQTVVRHAEEVAGFEARIADAEAAIAERDGLLAAADALVRDQGTRIAQFEAERVDLSVLEKQLEAAQARNTRLAETNIALKSAIQDRDSVSIPPAVRDTTEPPPVEPVYEQVLRSYGHRPVSSDGETTQQMVMPPGQSPMAGVR